MAQGAKMSPKGDIGAQRIEQMGKAFKNQLGGKPMKSGLPYRKPEMAIDKTFGPGDKVC